MIPALPMTALTLALVVTAPPSLADELLWQIGERDDAHDELALGPAEYGAFAGDPVYVVGKSSPAEDWPYVHPGPADMWAGGTAHTFSVYFGLGSAPATGCRLVIDLQDTHSLRPPLLEIQVNDETWQRRCPPGGSEESIRGTTEADIEHVIEIDVPASAMRAGLNRIAISNVELSWVVYDWLGFYAPPGTELTTGAGATLQGVFVSPWTSQGVDGPRQEVTARVLVLEPSDDVWVRAPGATPVPVPAETGVAELALSLPAVTARRPVRVELVDGGRVIDSAGAWRGPAPLREPVDYVDCLIGTGTSRWMLYPGPSMPFGMVKLSPDNQHQGWKAGYEYAITNIAGFSHIHSWTMGGLLTMPTAGPLEIEPGSQSDPDAGYRSPFSHDTETAVPGYYAVTLEDHGTRAELTATTRAGFQRYTFAESDGARILFDLQTPTEYGYDVLDARITKVSDTEIEGYSVQRGRGGARWNDYTVHFVARVDKPFRAMGAWVNGDVRPKVSEVTGEGDVGCYLELDLADGEQVLLQTGISLVSVEQARLNLETELEPFGWDFDATRKAARDTWADLL
ncbi:MAG: hypothetical protein GF320_00025, partial [Armatimonadia bacterium]|nr:hypothetical protein [Armatimonadia bacterium]